MLLLPILHGSHYGSTGVGGCSPSLCLPPHSCCSPPLGGSFSGLCSFRGHGQLPTPLGFVPWAWSSFLDPLGLDLEFWPGPFLSVVGILLPSVRLTTTPGLSSDLPGFPGGKSSSLSLMPLVIYALWICSSERKAHFELAKEYFLSGWNISTKHRDLRTQISAVIPRMSTAVMVRSNCKEKFLHLATLPLRSVALRRLAR